MTTYHIRANGYDVTVTRVTLERIAEWKQEERKDD